MKLLRNPIVTLLATVLLAGLLMLILKKLELEPALLALMQRVESMGYVGQLLFMLTVSLAVIVLAPSVLLTLGAGALYGVAYGSLVMVIAETLGSVVAFLLARTVLRKVVSGMTVRRPRLRRVLEITQTHDWQLVAMLRMIPFFPFKLSNYFLGLTPVSTTSYIKGTLIGLWPVTVFNVYLGSLAGDLMLLEQAGNLRTPWHWALYGAGLVFTGVVVVLAVRRATRALNATYNVNT